MTHHQPIKGDNPAPSYFDLACRIVTPAPIEALAEHCYERHQHGGDFTRITLRAPHGQKGSVFIALVDGWLPEGLHTIGSRTYRLTLTPQQSGAPWWRTTEIPASFPRLALRREDDEQDIDTALAARKLEAR